MKKTNEVSKLVGVTKRTLQYYDDEGLLGLERSSENYRMYDEKTMERIWKILMYKAMDFSLLEIKQLLISSDEQKKVYFEHRKKVLESQIIELKVKLGLVSIVRNRGMPTMPDDNVQMTYIDKIEEIKNKIRREEERI